MTLSQGFNMSKEQTDWVLVPREPTPEMLDASIGHREPYLTDAHLRVLRDGFATKYRAMIAAAPTSPSPAGGMQAVTVKPWKYDEVLLPFLSMMEAELHANSGKGDRPDWLAMSREEVLLEIYYHLAKLQKAVRNDDADGIREFAADVANMSMMAVDICGAWPLSSLKAST